MLLSRTDLQARREKGAIDNPMGTHHGKRNCGSAMADGFSGAWVDLMLDAAAGIGVELSVPKARLFARYGRELALWNKRINLTAVKDPVQVALKHFADSIIVLKYLNAARRVLDLGSGGGFPGLPLKIMRPEINLVLVDGVGKKVNFIKHVIRSLGLLQVRALHMRAEEMAVQRCWQGEFDHVVCRAVGTVEQVAALALPLMAPQGRLWIWKAGSWREKETGQNPLPEGDSFTVSAGGGVFQAVTHRYDLPGDYGPRLLVELKRLPD